MDKKNITGATDVSSAPDNANQENASHLDSEKVENGVRLVELTHEGAAWRLGATTPNWRNAISNLSATPTQENFQDLQGQGIWLSPAKTPPRVAITCAGQGTLWMHMGRELYDTFPAARAAMDRVAAVASWDVLSLMDDTDLEKISRTRYQAPYIFLVSYAQACYLESLGFKPDLYSGHSLGELVALFLAGSLSLEDAWTIFDKRFLLVDELEHGSKHDTGMMAVYAPLDVVEEAINTFVGLRISNYNSPTQYILSGPRDILAEARRSLRKRKFPAIILNVSMAFHHPHLRVLRDVSVEGLLKLDIKGTHTPAMSNVTAGIYPDDKINIVEYILDLDENAVRWVDCVRTMWGEYNIRHFVELGPSDVISGLTADIEPNARCLSVCRKGKEVEAMRRAVAELYALGHISGPSLYVVPDDLEMPSKADTSIVGQAEQESQKNSLEKTPPHVEDIMPILMEITGLPRHKLAAHMDLRHDLAMRSSRFPVIIHKLETTFDIQINFEDIMHVSTIGDLAQAVANFRSKTAQVENNIQITTVVDEDNFESQTLIKIKENMQDYPHIYPLGLTSEELPLFKARRNFSVYTDAYLQDQQCATPLVFAQNMLDALYAGAHMGFADLNCCGLNDMKFEKPFACPNAVTREGYISVQAQAWENSTLSCKAELHVHDITANGRRMQTRSIMAFGHILFNKGACAVKPIWQESLQTLLDTQVICEYILPRKTFAEQCHSSYTWPPTCVALLKQLATPEGEHFDIIDILCMRHVPELPNVDTFKLLWKLQKVASGYELEAQLCNGQDVILTVQGMHISKKDKE